MSKTTTQKLARARHRERQKQLMETGRQAAALLSVSQRQAISASGRAAQLEGELSEARRALGNITNELGEARTAKLHADTILQGLREELTAASEEVAKVTAELSELTTRHQATLKELAALKAADSDAKSLRTRLANKTSEIVDLRAKFQGVLADLRAEKAKSGISFDASRRNEETKTEVSKS